MFVACAIVIANVFFVQPCRLAEPPVHRSALVSPSPSTAFCAILLIMADSKEAPKNVDLGVFRKLAQRVEKTLETQVINKEPKTIDPRFILVAMMNRD